MDYGDTRPECDGRGVERGGRPVDLDPTGIGAEMAGEDVDQRALAGSILAAESSHLSGPNLQIQRMKRDDPVEDFEIAASLSRG